MIMDWEKMRPENKTRAVLESLMVSEGLGTPRLLLLVLVGITKIKNVILRIEENIYKSN